MHVTYFGSEKIYFCSVTMSKQLGHCALHMCVCVSIRLVVCTCDLLCIVTKHTQMHSSQNSSFLLSKCVYVYPTRKTL